MIGSTELIAILIAVLFLFGPRKLPELARSLGSAVGEFKKAQRAAELGLTDFDPYTRKVRQEGSPGENGENKDKEEEEKEEVEEENKKETNSDLGSVLEAKSSLPEKEGKGEN
ncbi:Sec-independent protein translocase subunit TatA/TatB [Methanosarcina sp. Mfa9]|uniref:Sec-independent protein translocase subunit TatA/TatB n=1 Tax=Methanosarcina sp. Mfa9 TaxID=3439063 RepID=UPI003F849C13